jgi:hypothetical protein
MPSSSVMSTSRQLALVVAASSMGTAANVRYTALSVPYNIGTGWVGGLLPVSAFAIVAASGDIYSGLLYPFAFTGVGIVTTLLFFPETNGRSLELEEVHA